LRIFFADKMSFLFKSKKHQSSNALPPATRNIHTSEGAPSSSGLNGIREKDGERPNQSPAPAGRNVSNVNNSVSSLGGTTGTPDHQWPRQRERADSDIQVRNLHRLAPIYLTADSCRLERAI
jgi:hypothetical protein